MLYLEDYLEMIEHLPQELRDRFTEIREMDLQVHNAMDHLEEEVKTFFSNAKRAKPDVRELEFQKIKSEYVKTLEDAEEKVSLANQLFDLVERYLRRLDTELDKFKNELEADHAGITEILERRSHELDVPPTHSLHNHTPHQNNVRKKQTGSGQFSHSSLSSNSTSANGGSLAFSAPLSSSGSASASLNLNNASYAIAAAASQAIAATNQMQSGRRTASLKASIDAAFNLGTLGGGSFSSSFDAPALPFSGVNDSSASHSRTNKRIRSASNQYHDSDSSEALPSFGANGDGLNSWTLDPDEPTYCICNQVSYGEMVACDNEDCEIEWFHYACVALNAAPKGKWFCPPCVNKMKRRRTSERN